MRASDAAFVGAFSWRFPEFMPLLQKHLDAYDGLLPHVWMGDLTRSVISRFRTDAADPLLRDVLDFIEMAFEQVGGEDRELITASFLENLPRREQVGAELRSLLGPALQDQLRHME